MRHGSGAARAPYQPSSGQASSPCRRGNDNPYTPPAGMGESRMSLSPRDSDFSICLLPGGLDENSGMVRQDAPAGSRTGDGPAIWPSPSGGSCCGATLRRQGQKKRSPGSGAPHHAARKGERYQRLALKKASILSKGMMSTRSYRSVCEARGTIISSLLLPLSFLKASSLK